MAAVNQDEEELAALMCAAQAGDKVAYLALLKRVAPIAVRMARKRWLGSQTPDDVAQDVLLSVHSVRHTYDPGRAFLPWLRTIIHNRIVDAQRREMRRSRNLVFVDEPPETFVAEETNWLDDGPGDPQELTRAIAELPPGQRQAIDLLKLKEMSLKDAAAVSGMSVGALKVAVHRAMNTLRTVLSR
tara:strand:- start:5662 stop:6219 length:558 start_codon:yes stop_codon:yes gene_type:complete